MSVIQKIRNKYIGFVIGAIVVALVGFLVMDAMQSNVSNMFSGDNSKLGEVNGTRIDFKDYTAKREQYEQNLKSRNKDGIITEENRNQAQTAAWDDMVNDILMGSEMEKLGIDLTDKELVDMLMGPYAEQSVKQSFTDPQTGVFNPEKVKEFLNQLPQDKTGARREEWKNFEDGLIRSRKMQKYNDLITKGIYVPKFMVDLTQKWNESKASISYVNVPYSTISDSTIKISDEDVKAYIDKHQKMFTAQEAFANIEYVSFDIIPTREDTGASLGSLITLRDTFMKASDAALESLVANNSEETLSDNYLTEAEIKMPNPAEVLSAENGTVLGPLFMQDAYRMVKVLDKKSKPDSVKASHVLIKIDEKRNEDQAKTIIDSLEAAVKGGANLAAIATASSEDPGSGSKGGDLGYFGQGQMVPEFNDACFNGQVGDLTVVKTQFGYHLIKVTDQKSFKPAVKLAIMAKSLLPSTTTTSAVYAKANQFVANAKDAAAFNAEAKKVKMDKRIAEYITGTAQEITGLGKAREISRWAFGAKIGEVSPVFNLENKCVIAILSSRQEKDALMSVKTVKPQVESMLRNEKKAKIIADKYKGKTLEQIAAASASQVKMADSITYAGGTNPEISTEPKVIGGAFNKNLMNKVSEGIQGNQAVYFIKVNNINEATIPKDNPMMNMMRQQMASQVTQSAAQMIPYILKQKSKMVDNRAKMM